MCGASNLACYKTVEDLLWPDVFDDRMLFLSLLADEIAAFGDAADFDVGDFDVLETFDAFVFVGCGVTRILV